MIEKKYLKDYYLYGKEGVERVLRNEELPKWTREWNEVKKICCNRKCWCHYAYLICYIGALIINSLAVVSIPWLPDTQCYIVQAKLQGSQKIDGFLNGLEVDQLDSIRMGLWASCYSDAGHKTHIGQTGACLPWAVNYQVIVTRETNSKTVALPVLVALLKFQGFAAASTLITFVCGLKNYVHWYAGVAATFTALTLGADFLLWTVAKNKMKGFGPGIEVKLGPGFGWIVIALILLLVGSAFQFVEGKAVEQEEADKEAFNDEQSTRRIQESNHIKLFQKG